jgi:Zn-dependent M28 family amino/carboxypeptidase
MRGDFFIVGSRFGLKNRRLEIIALFCCQIYAMRYFLLFLVTLFSFNSFAQKVNKYIKEKQVRAVLSTLAADDMQGRKPMTPGIDKAAAFIAGEFAKAGLEPLDKASGSFLQKFTMYRSEVKQQAVTINGTSFEGQSCLIFPGVEELKWDNIGAEIVYIKAGENAGQGIFGQVQSGKNVLVVADTSHQKTLGRFRNFRMQRMAGTGSVVVVLYPGLVNQYKVQVTSTLTGSEFANVAGIIPGKSKPEERVIFSAHYDHLGIGKAKDQDSIYNGANDDASGTTGVIALARYFRKKKRPERTLVFSTFTAEESGGYGAQYFSRQMDPASVIAMFNIEMIGTDSKWGKNSAYITGFEKSDFGQILQDNLRGSAFEFHPDPYPSENLFYRSDNATLARLGVPAHTISTSKMDSEKFYHTVDDEIGTLDTKNMTEIIKAIAVSSKSIVNGSSTPTRVKEQ